jgi:hypothetical protein
MFALRLFCVLTMYLVKMGHGNMNLMPSNMNMPSSAAMFVPGAPFHVGVAAAPMFPSKRGGGAGGGSGGGSRAVIDTMAKAAEARTEASKQQLLQVDLSPEADSKDPSPMGDLSFKHEVESNTSMEYSCSSTEEEGEEEEDDRSRQRKKLEAAEKKKQHNQEKLMDALAASQRAADAADPSSWKDHLQAGAIQGCICRKAGEECRDPNCAWRIKAATAQPAADVLDLVAGQKLMDAAERRGRANVVRLRAAEEAVAAEVEASKLAEAEAEMEAR